MRYWLAAIAVCLAGCSSSGSSSVTAIPLAVPAVSTGKPVENTYTGILIDAIAASPNGWRLRNLNMPGNLPIDVSKVLATAKSLNGQMVVVRAHSITSTGGQTILEADSIEPYVPA